MFEEILAATIRQATPLLLAALGEVVVQRSGVINIGIEGMMLMGAFFGMLGSFYTGSMLPGLAPWVGMIVAGLSGGITAYVFAFLTIRLSADQVVTGTGITLLALGLTEVIYQRVFSYTGSALKVAAFREVQIPFLSSIPGVGPALFQHNVLVFLTFLFVP
jgi:simple sugar transport system permease protein